MRLLSSPPSFLRHATVLALILAIAPGLLEAQSGTVSGRVLDTQGAPVQGATVTLAGTTPGAIVRGDGSYRLTGTGRPL